MPISDAEQLELQLIMRSPSHFRNRLVIDIENRGKSPLGQVIEPWQQVDYAAIDPAMMWLAGRRADRPQKTRAWLQRARGHSKTTDIAVMLTWLLLSSQRQVRGIGGAEDKDQAKLLRDQMVSIGENNEWLKAHLSYKNYVIENVSTQSSLTIISSDVASSWGFTPDFVICDEFTHWTQPGFWTSMFTSYAKKNGVLIIGCNAGAGRDWKWNVREGARVNPEWHFSSPEGCIASWFTPQALAEQRAMIPPNEYSRLWENRWQETGGEFVSLDEAEACRDENLRFRDKGIPGWSYIAVVDYAEKKDYTVGLVGHVENRRIIIDRMDVIVPRPDRPTKPSWVREWMKNVQADFRHVRFVIDKYQLLGTAEDLIEHGFEIEEFDFGSGNGNYEMAVAFRQCILAQRVRWPAGTGAIDQPWGRDDLETELASLVVTPYSNGKRWRFDHLRDDTHHDDRAFVTGVLCLHCCKGRKEGFGYFGVTDPNAEGNFNLAAA